jgi:hypothetical protein
VLLVGAYVSLCSAFGHNMPSNCVLLRLCNNICCPTLRYYWLPPPHFLCTPHSKGTPVVLWFCWAG